MGLFNEIFEELSADLIETFVDTERPFRRRTTVYDPSVGSDVASNVAATFLSGPPTPFSKGEIGTSFGNTVNTVKVGDAVMIVATKHYQEKGFDIEPTSEAQVFVTVEGQEYLILGANPFDAGDGNVAMRLHLRR